MLITVLKSSIGRKFLMALTGLLFCGFVAEHLIGNLLLLNPDPKPYNEYAHFITSMSELVIFAEIILILTLIIHVITAITIGRDRAQARPVRYKKIANAGKPSRKTIASSTMVFTGLLLLLFIISHIKAFKYGPIYIDEELTKIHGGVEVRDLHRLVSESFSQLNYVIGYVVMMTLLGLHLRHGFWSAFQSIGIKNPRYSNLIYSIGGLFAITVAVGFIAIPIFIYIREVILQ